MNTKTRLLAINGSASPDSSNYALLRQIAAFCPPETDIEILEDLSVLPHFNTARTEQNVPSPVQAFRKQIEAADAIVICTPEYVFSIPARLKNAIEWCVSTTVLSGKPLGLITASASGEKGHEQLKLLMDTLQASFTDETTLLIRGIKGKIDRTGTVTDQGTMDALRQVTQALIRLIGTGKE